MAEAGAAVAGEFIRTHRDSAPLLYLVEAVLDDVAAAVADPLCIAEVNGTAAPFATVNDLISRREIWGP